MIEIHDKCTNMFISLFTNIVIMFGILNYERTCFILLYTSIFIMFEILTYVRNCILFETDTLISGVWVWYYHATTYKSYLACCSTVISLYVQWPMKSFRKLFETNVGKPRTEAINTFVMILMWLDRGSNPDLPLPRRTV